MLRLSVIVPTHNPHPGRLARTLDALAAQTLPVAEWETLLVDNASVPSLGVDALAPSSSRNLRIVREVELGLSHARRCGLQAARGELCVFVDDDNCLAPDYLANALDAFARHPELGAAGGPSRPEFETPPPDWAGEFLPLLALRDLGSEPTLAKLETPVVGGHPAYPACAPIGAGMVVRRSAVQSWIDRSDRGPADRRGRELTSGGDNDIVLSILRAGWQVGYFPELALTHLIPASRLDPDYLARLNRGIQKSWMQVLALHDANPWPPISRGSVPLRKMKAWLHHRAWESSAAFIRWQGSCGHFEGRALPTSAR